MTKPSLPAALLTDMDGLLLDTEKLSLMSFESIAARYGLHEWRGIFDQLIGRKRADHMRIFTGNLPPGIDPAAFDDAWKADFTAMLDKAVPVKPGARPMLAWLAGQGVPIALVTSSQTDKADWLMRRTGLKAHIDIIIGGDQVEAGKPAPDIYLKAAASLGIDAAACLAFEDSANGVRAAHAAGVRVIQVIDLIPPDEDLRSLGHEIVASLAEAGAMLGWDFIADSP